MLDLKHTFIIAEIGMNHDGSFGQARALMKAAAECGVDAVKFQMHIFDAESLPDAPPPPYFQEEDRKTFFNRTAFSLDQWKNIRNYSNDLGVEFVCSPFSIEAIERLEEIGNKVYKVPSGEVTNIPYLERIAQTGKSVLLSSGMSNWQELDKAVHTLKKWNDHIVVLQCSSLYPCPPEKAGLNVMQEMQARYSLPVGLSDHTLTIYTSLAAVVLGAKVIERHFSVSRSMYGPDAKYSLDPTDMKNLCEGIRIVEAGLTHFVDKNDISDYKNMKEIFEKSIVTRRAIKKGKILERDDITTKKPGTGIKALMYHDILGRKVKRDLAENMIVSWSDLEHES